ncbi:MAG: SHOCT domain-containing protein [candidate division NC10 bacterium]|nr:SHOCT domain-containing protein [candidate division NC10 bacterium]MBI2116206.1 SHOCT domain-containing protein [candidate division NC10 bacterium]MBI2164580.1 SHOCT domain-containing protein [candidate division NC10 bacterium]MBI3122728.1 SHOCT domain-containing protein [candidate division NC10 bacterium]
MLSLAQEKRRYARGEISREEFENMRRDLLA